MCELRFGDPSKTKEHGAEPNFLDMGLMCILGDDLLNGELSPALDVLA
jgi:hypothetical protein